jgi:NADPH-dependent curcumin reductase CurA
MADFDLPARNRRLLLVRRPTGVPGPRHFAMEDAPRPVAGPGQILVRNLYLSIDPAQRGWVADAASYVASVPLGSVMRSLGLGIVLNSNEARIAEGEFVYGWLGWQDYAAITFDQVLTSVAEPRLPLAAYASVLGISGMTAHLALEQLGRPKTGEAVLVSAAAGAVGSIVAQLARRMGCRVVGLAGSDEKAARCVARYGCDVAIDYHLRDLESALRVATPNGIDIFFDNTGGEILDLALRHMAPFGRIIQCGTVAVPVWSPPPIGPRNEREMLTRRLSWSGFLIFDHIARCEETVEFLVERVLTGELVYDVEIDNGLEQAPSALVKLYQGVTLGKKLIFVGRG